MSTNCWHVSAWILAAVLAPGLLCAEELSLKWSEIPKSLVTGRTVAVHLTGGTVLRGHALSVTPEGLQMAVSHAPKGAAKYGRGEFLIPAGEIASLKVNRTGTRGRIIGTAIGGGIAALAGGLVHTAAKNETGESSPLVAVAVAVPLGIGYLAGWAMDLKTTTIQVIPEPKPR